MIYEDFKGLCASGHQPGSFSSYCRERGVSYLQMHDYLKRHGLKAVGLPGYLPYRYERAASGKAKSAGSRRKPRCVEVPFENVIFDEAGFIPADMANVITVKVDGHTVVCFPADTDISEVARFIRKMGKEACHVES